MSYIVKERDFLDYSDSHDDSLHNVPPVEININGNYMHRYLNISINNKNCNYVFLSDLPIVIAEDTDEFDELVAGPSSESNIGIIFVVFIYMIPIN